MYIYNIEITGKKKKKKKGFTLGPPKGNQLPGAVLKTWGSKGTRL